MLRTENFFHILVSFLHCFQQKWKCKRKKYKYNNWDYFSFAQNDKFASVGASDVEREELTQKVKGKYLYRDCKIKINIDDNGMQVLSFDITRYFSLSNEIRKKNQLN